jgi:hypothetical protein
MLADRGRECGVQLRIVCSAQTYDGTVDVVAFILTGVLIHRADPRSPFFVEHVDINAALFNFCG